VSEIEATKRDLKEILERIPASGSFEGARLATLASRLAVKYANLVSGASPEDLVHTLASAHAKKPESKSDPVP
jgi:hypothetical protein